MRDVSVDTAGNEKQLVDGMGLYYDGENHRQEAPWVNGKTQENYDYDGEGRRVRHQELT